MRKPKLYLETSVWNFIFADDAPEKKEITLKFFNRINDGEYDIFISDLVTDEILKTEAEKRDALLKIVGKYKPANLTINEETRELAEIYISENVLSDGSLEDAIHAAVATVNEIGALISWILKHLANFRRMEMINGVNMKAGYYKRLELITPMEVCNEEI